MKYKKIDMGNYNLHLVNTKKFKTISISVNIRERITKENITKRKLLFEMLATNSKKYNSNRLLQIELENLYSLSLGHSNVVFGNVINSYIDLKFLNNKYSDNNLLNDSVDLLIELLFNPNVDDNKFDLKQFNIAKSMLQLILDSRKENTPKYSLVRALEGMDPSDPATINLWGYEDELNKITPSSLYEYYKEVLKTNKIDIFVVGDINEEDIIELFQTKFKLKNIVSEKFEPFITYNECNDTMTKEESLNIKQSRLAIVCKLLNLSIYERRYVLPIYADILGGVSTSRLFMNVREKNSLAYNISAMSKGPNSMFFITAGIDAKNYDKTIELINKELYLTDVTNDEINTAKEEIIASIDTLFDDPIGIINYYFGIEVFNADKKIKKINSYKKVNKEDIINLSKKIKVAMIYLLKGTTDEKN